MFSKLSSTFPWRQLKRPSETSRPSYRLSVNQFASITKRRSFASLPSFKTNIKLLPTQLKNNQPQLILVTRRYKHDDEEEKPVWGYWSWKELLTLIGGLIGLYLSFLIWGWNFRFTSLREFNLKNNTEENTKKQELLNRFLLDNLPKKEVGMSDIEYYELICVTIAERYLELKRSNPAEAEKLYAAALSLFNRFRDGRFLFETLKAFHKIGAPMKLFERTFFGSNSEQLFQDEIVGRYCYRVKLLMKCAFPIISVENYLAGNHLGSDEELLEAISWYSAKCKCVEDDVYTLVGDIDKSVKMGFLPNRNDIKRVYLTLEAKIPKQSEKLSEIKEDKDTIIMKQQMMIKELEEKCASLQFELHRSKDLYLYSSLKFMMNNKEHRDEIMKLNKESSGELKKKLMKLSDH